MTIGDDIKDILGSVRRAETKADEAVKTSSEAVALAKQAKGDVIKMTSRVAHAYDCSQEIRGKQEKLDRRIRQIEVSGGVRPAGDVWLKLGLVSFVSSALGMILIALVVRVF